MPTLHAAKQAAAVRAVRDYFGQHIGLKFGAIGIGSGSTICYVVDEIKALARSSLPELLQFRYVPSSFQSKLLIVDAGLPLGDLEQFPCIDVAFDGADEIDQRLNCIKGGGGAHLQEKIVASSADTFIVVADFTKQSAQLGTKWDKGVPLEVLPLAHKAVLRRLQSIGCKEPLLRMSQRKAGPVITDFGNFIIDANFGPIDDPVVLNLQLKSIPGVLETGLFLGMTTQLYLGQEDGSVSVWDRQALSPDMYKRHVDRLEASAVLNILASQY